MSPPPILLAVAAPLEASAIQLGFGGGGGGLGGKRVQDWSVTRLSDQFRLVQTGIGKANAAAAVSRALTRSPYRAVISLGIAGSLAPDLGLGQIVLGEASVSVEEGLLTPQGFQTCAQMGFPLGPFDGNGVLPDSTLFEALKPLVAAPRGRTGVIATVSTCSGTDEGARTVVSRTGAIAEAMEGAAVGQAVARLAALDPRRGAGFAELRVISNTTGDRGRQRWDIKLAAGVLTEVAAELPRLLTR